VARGDADGREITKRRLMAGTRTRMKLMRQIKTGSICLNQQHQFHPRSGSSLSEWNTDETDVTDQRGLICLDQQYPFHPRSIRE
jgi:hypothetical protein